MTDRNKDSRIFVGDVKKPIAVIKRGEIKGYITDEFLGYYSCWQRLENGFGLPYGDGWAQYPEIFVAVISQMVSVWKGLKSGSI